MASQKEFDSVYIGCVEQIARLSRARRLQVGALVVSPDGNIISYGFNGTPSKFDNNCEIDLPNGTLQTKPEVLHAESNAIVKIAKTTSSSIGATMYCSHSCCLECSKLIIQAEVKRFVYLNDFRTTEGLDLLRQANIEVQKWSYSQLSEKKKFLTTGKSGGTSGGFFKKPQKGK